MNLVCAKHAQGCGAGGGAQHKLEEWKHSFPRIVLCGRDRLFHRPQVISVNHFLPVLLIANLCAFSPTGFQQSPQGHQDNFPTTASENDEVQEF